MKHFFKKSLCVFLTVLMIAAAFVPFAFAGNEEYPMVYIRGYGSSTFDSKGNEIDAKDVDKDYILNATKDVLKEMPANPNGDWSRYCDALYNCFAPLYDDVRLNKDGEPVDGGATWKYRQLNWVIHKTSNFAAYDYWFSYDWRVDPYETAKELALYIDKVLAATGKKKVTLVGRCLGACIAAAYLEMTENVENKVANVIFNIPSVGGVELFGALFSGNIVLDDVALDRYLTEKSDSKQIFEDPALQSLLVAAVSLARYCKIVGVATGAVTEIYKRVYKDLVPRLALTSYGSFPSFWSMVGTEYYEEAKALCFGGQEEEYAKMIEKTDHFYNNVTVRLTEIIKDLTAKGINFSYIAKYNTSILPVCKECNLQADGVTSLSVLSGGATSADIGKVLPASYIEEAKAKGTDKYISADKIVDASTCLFPDRTWFVKDLPHAETPDYLDRLTERISRGNGNYTVFSDSAYPQYMSNDPETGAMTPSVSPEPTKAQTPKDILKALFNFLTKLFRFLTKLSSKSAANS